jgi:3-isopropylmalate/(R)-2-methylmalate dehydratase small subunit
MKITQITGQGIPLKGDDIDTDRLIPARFLRCVTFDGLGEQVFADDRTQAQGKHPFDLPQYQEATLLVVNKNFGCGSSREHAPQALIRWGIQGIIGESFAEIFLGNCIANGVPCVTADTSTVTTLQNLIENEPQGALTLDIGNMTVNCANFSAPVVIAAGMRQMLIEGTWDTCSQLTQNTANIQETAAKLPYLSWA